MRWATGGWIGRARPLRSVSEVCRWNVGSIGLLDVGLGLIQLAISRHLVACLCLFLTFLNESDTSTRVYRTLFPWLLAPRLTFRGAYVLFPAGLS